MPKSGKFTNKIYLMNVLKSNCTILASAWLPDGPWNGRGNHLVRRAECPSSGPSSIKPQSQWMRILFNLNYSPDVTFPHTIVRLSFHLLNT